MKNSSINSNKKPAQGFVKPKNILPKLEEYPEKGLLMAFTVNPKEQHFSSVDRLMKVADYTLMILQSYNAKYELYYEVSPESRIHFHGYIKIYDYFRWILIDLPQILENFTVALKPLDGDEGVDKWDIYCMKQQPIHGLQPLFIKRCLTHLQGHETKSYLTHRNHNMESLGIESTDLFKNDSV